MMARAFMVATLIVAGYLGGCSKDENKAQEVVKTAGPKPVVIAPEARQLFQMRCAMCHGTSGRGDGQASATLEPKPRNYTDKEWQASVTDAQIAETIIKGGQATGKSPLMPANGDIQPEMAQELVKLIRSFGSK